MNLIPLCEMEMHYTWVDYVDYGVGASTSEPWRAR